jgi:Zn-dependent peptidase ImmA (M78 family)/transcriptional regulator with XRE-family HTH domain
MIRRKEKTFNGEKIKEARELHELSMLRLASEVGVTRQSIHNYETGIQTPRPDVVEKLAATLKVKWDFFMEPSRQTSKTTFFRSLAAATSVARQSAARWLDFVESVVKGVEVYLTLPPLDLPDITIGAEDVPLLQDEEIDQIALDCREHWRIGLGPIDNLTGLLESKGIVIYMAESESNALDAYSRWNKANDRPYVHLCENKHCAVRSRFDLAHELGHIVMHRYINEKDFSTRNNFKLYEDQANRFAGAFLMPDESFSRDLIKINLDYLEALKPRWKASIGSMIMRVKQMGFIDRDEEVALWMNYARKGYKKKEPLDDIIPVEKPVWITEAIRKLIEYEQATNDQILSRIPYTSEFVAQRLGLEDVLLTKRPDPSELLRKSISNNFVREGKIIKPALSQ